MDTYSHLYAYLADRDIPRRPTTMGKAAAEIYLAELQTNPRAKAMTSPYKMRQSKLMFDRAFNETMTAATERTENP